MQIISKFFFCCLLIQKAQKSFKNNLFTKKISKNLKRYIKVFKFIFVFIKKKKKLLATLFQLKTI